MENRAPTPAELKQAFDEFTGRRAPKPEKTFYDVYDEFMETVGRQNSWSDATYTKFNTLREHFQNFDKNLSFETLTEEILQGFIASLHTADLRNTTISKYMDFVRWFLRWSHNKGHYNGVLYETFKPRLKGVDGNAKEVIYLEWEELLSLYSF